MSTDTVATFFALLAGLAVGFGVAGVVAAVGLGVGGGGGWRAALVDLALPQAAAVAVTATLGSLYFSEVAHFEPCRYCWFQRTAMYPLAVILPIAAWRRDLEVWRYGLPLACGGLAVSIYHLQLQWRPGAGEGACGTGPPCTLKYVEVFGFVTIPAMAAAGFVAIAGLLVLARRAGVVGPVDDLRPGRPPNLEESP